MGEENTITAAKVLIAVKEMEAGLAAGCGEIRHEMLKPLNKVIWLTCMRQAAWCSGRGPEDWQAGVIIPIDKKGDSGECTK